jgi:hypothetical protein
MGVLRSEVKKGAAAAGRRRVTIRKPSLAAKPMDPQSQHALLAELDTLLVLADASAVALFDQHAAQLGAALGWTSEALGLQIKQFEFNAAHQTL